MGAFNRALELRLKKGVSRRKAAKEIGIPYSTLEEIEKMITSNIPEKYAEKIAKYYNLANTQELFQGGDSQWW